MSDKLLFTKLKKENIFCNDFLDFKTNNEIEFSKSGIVVLYGPNGTGKTSFTKVLNCEKSGVFEVNYIQRTYNQMNNELFHIINDQNSRNIISGETEDFLLGENIRKEYELKNKIDEGFKKLFENQMSSLLKNDFSISTVKNNLIELVNNTKLRGFIKEIANSKVKGKNINRKEFIEEFEKIVEKEIEEIEEIEDSKFNFIKNNYTDSISVISKIINITDEHIKKDTSINIIEENTEAIKILKKFIHKTECVVCDCENIDSNQLFESKKINKENVINALDKKTKAILEEIINEVKSDDPFNIKQIFIKAIEEGNKTIINELQEEIKKYFIFFDNIITNSLVKCYKENKIIKEYFDEYDEILKSKPEMTDEDIMYIETLVNENIEKEIKLDRDANNNLKLLLDGNDFIGINRNELHLSNGEQNFISLAFELLKAKNTTNKIIILDDPISSFDSIYKNKIAYLIIKVLEKKKQIILSHNVDLIRLLEHQKQKCFNLYLFNNKDGEINGFIKVNENEQKILLYIDKLLELFRNGIESEIEDKKTFLTSIIPFMRGYAQIINNVEQKNNLTKLMHGYEIERINVTEIFNTLFNQNFSPEYFVSAKEISELNINNLTILKNENYPLLNKTLKHSLNYLYLRLNVEKVLSQKFGVDTTEYYMLSHIILQSFKGEDSINTKHRVFFTSRKTLLNEFNHFEGNMNIFQPAIDISDTALEKEKKSIMEYLENLQN